MTAPTGFGLSELYQLRGRVGRYKHQAYAYLLLPRHARLLTDVRKRISAMKQYATLGSGFKIAMRDLEIRGAGNLLGAEQSGHITAVGFELYCQLLKQSVGALEGEKVKPRVEVRVALDFLETENVMRGMEAARGDRRAARGTRPSPTTMSPSRIIASRFTASWRKPRTSRRWRRCSEELRDRFGPLPAAGGIAAGRGGTENPGGRKERDRIEVEDGQIEAGPRRRLHHARRQIPAPDQKGAQGAAQGNQAAVAGALALLSGEDFHDSRSMKMARAGGWFASPAAGHCPQRGNRCAFSSGRRRFPRLRERERVAG